MSEKPSPPSVGHPSVPAPTRPEEGDTSVEGTGNGAIEEEPGVALRDAGLLVAAGRHGAALARLDGADLRSDIDAELRLQCLVELDRFEDAVALVARCPDLPFRNPHYALLTARAFARLGQADALTALLDRIEEGPARAALLPSVVAAALDAGHGGLAGQACARADSAPTTLRDGIRDLVVGLAGSGGSDEAAVRALPEACGSLGPDELVAAGVYVAYQAPRPVAGSLLPPILARLAAIAPWLAAPLDRGADERRTEHWAHLFDGIETLADWFAVPTSASATWNAQLRDNFLRTAAANLVLASGPEAALRMGQPVHAADWEPLWRAQREGRSVLLVSTHFGLLPLLGTQIAAGGVPASILGGPPDLNEALAPHGAGAEFTQAGRIGSLRQALRRLREGGVVATSFDNLDVGPLLTVVHRGTQLSLSDSAPALAYRAGAVPVWGSVHWRHDRLVCEVVPFPTLPDGDYGEYRDRFVAFALDRIHEIGRFDIRNVYPLTEIGQHRQRDP